MRAQEKLIRGSVSALLSAALIFTPVFSAISSEPAAPAKLSNEQKVIHLLDRISFGPRPGDVDKVLKMGWEKYLDEQMAPERITDDVIARKLEGLSTLRMSSQEIAAVFDPPPVVVQQVREQLEKKDQAMAADQNKQASPPVVNQPPDPAKQRELQKALAEMGFKPRQGPVVELQQAKILRAVYSERQFQEVLSDFWFNHFNIFAQKGQDRVLLTSYERDVIHPNVFGKFQDLLLATAKSPAMLFYLDNWMSVSPNANPPRPLAANNRPPIPPAALGGGIAGGLTRAERMARQERLRQIQQAQNQARQAGTLPPAQQPKKQTRGINENYAREIMELHTLGVDGGYTQKDVQEVARCFTGWTLRQPRQGANYFFNEKTHDNGEKIVLGQKIPANGGEKDGELVIRILAHHPSTARFVSTKLARKFVSDTPPPSLIDKMASAYLKSDGDLKTVYKVMFTSKEFWAPEAFRSKIKTPFEMTISAVRALGADTTGAPGFHRWIQQMGEGLYLAQPPTGYKDEAEQWVNTGALLDRMNFAIALSSNKIPGTRVDFPSDLRNRSPKEVAEYFVNSILRGNITPQTRATINKTLSEQQMAMNNQTDVAKIAGLVLGSPEFQRQ